MKRAQSPVVIALSAIVTLAWASPVGAQQVESEIEQLTTRVQVGRTEKLHLIAPRHFSEAEKKVTEARRLYERGGRLGDIRSRLAEARDELAKAGEFEEIGRVILREAFTARDAALAANAPEFAADLWDGAEGSIRAAGREIEDGDQNDARTKAAEAVERFQRAELLAIRRDVLGNTRERRDEARRRDAHEKAAMTFRSGDSLLGAAERLLREDRYRQGEATELARDAARAYENAIRMAGIVDQVRANQNTAVEALVRRYDAQLARIAEVLDFEPSFLEGPEEVTEQSVTAIQSLYAQRTGLQQDVQNREQRIAALRSQVDSLEGRLTRLADSLGAQAELEAARRRVIAARLEERRLREEKVERVRALFGPTEAEVLLRGPELIIRLLGLTFPVGSAEIRPANFPLLTKLQGALRQFADARAVTIAGHTDAQGNDEYNQVLSERRAEAVRQYLIANMGVSEDALSAIGFGESQPVATNETAEGRAKNRRIDVILALPPIEGG